MQATEGPSPACHQIHRGVQTHRARPTMPPYVQTPNLFTHASACNACHAVGDLACATSTLYLRRPSRGFRRT